MVTGEGEELRAVLSRYVEALSSGDPPARDSVARRRRMVPALRAYAAREHIRVRRRRTMRRASFFVTAVGGAAAAMLIVGGSVRRLRSPVRTGATISVLDGTLWLDEGTARRALSAGEASGVVGSDELEAPSERLARVRLADTGTLTLDPTSRVGTVLAAANAPESAPTFEALKLMRGRAHLQVHKLHGGQRFHVLTPDADVQVRGTEFDVELVDSHGGTASGTCVRVEEGLVAVVSGGQTHLVAPGQTWGCGETPHASSAAGPLAPPGVSLPVPARRVAAHVMSPSDLRRQNELFQQALEAERGGRYGVAAGLYRRLLARAPNGPLSAQARSNLAVVSRPR
jgi:hypothetical protein